MEAIVEREPYLARLAEAAAAASSDGGRVVVVEGEAGIGKSELIAAVVAEARLSGPPTARVLVGWCDDLSTPTPLAPIHDVARAAPAVAAALKAEDPRAILDALLDLLLGRRPTVLAVEDVQWADEATLDVIAALGRRIAVTRGLLVVTLRDTMVDADHPLQRVLGHLPASRVDRLRLQPLSVAAVTTLVGGDTRRAAEVHALTGGNPLFVREVLRADHGETPASVRDAVHGRVHRLPAAAREVVTTMSLVPGSSEWWVLKRVHAACRGDLVDARRLGLVTIDDRGVRFRHELQRRAVEESLGVDDRRRRHRALLNAMEGRSPPSRLVHHAIGAGDEDALMRHARAAGAAAARVNAHREACAHLRRAAALADRLPTVEAADLHEAWARAAMHVNIEEASTALCRAVELRRTANDADALARTLAFGISAQELTGSSADAAAWVDQAVALVKDEGPSAALAEALAEKARFHSFHAEVDDGIEVAARAIDVAERVGATGAAVRATIIEGDLRCWRGEQVRGSALLVAAQQRAHATGRWFEEADAMLMLAVHRSGHRSDDLVARPGPLGEGIELLDRARWTAAAHDAPTMTSFASALSSELLVETGDWIGAVALAEEVLATEPAPPLDAALVARRAMAMVATRRGDADADAAVERLWSAADELPDHARLHRGVAAVAAEHAWVTGRTPDRLARLDAVLDDRVRGVPLRLGDDLVFWMWRLGRCRHVPADLVDGYRLMIDGHDERAARWWAARGAPLQRGLALLGGDDESVVHGLRVLEDLGAEGTLARARAVLRTEGRAAPRGRSRHARTHPARLTRRQDEVLGLLAEGLSTAVIAERLVVSSRTVEGHVAGVLRRLDVPDRAAAVEWATRHGLVSVHDAAAPDSGGRRPDPSGRVVGDRPARS